MSLGELRESVRASVAERALALRQVEDERSALKTARESAADAEEAQKVAQLVAQTVQQQVHHRIAGVVSRCLAAVFEEPYTFEIRFEQKRGKTEAVLVFKDGDNELDPMSASGGGVVDVAAFALRLSALLLARPALRRVMILDEPFRFVSEEYQERVRDMMRELSHELKVQFIFVTHNERYQQGRVFRLANGSVEISDRVS